MAESLEHMTYVRKMVDYIPSFLTDFTQRLLFADLPGFMAKTPKVIGGSIPDLFYNDFNTVVIGEAKTPNDIDNDHTAKQLNDYIEEVRSYNVQKHIVFCTSIMGFSVLKNMIILKKRRESIDDIQFHILDNYKKVAII